VLPPELVETLTGERRWASLRPEAIRLEGGEGLTGTVVARSYLGPVTRLAIEAAGLRLHAALPSTGTLPAEGDAVTIVFDRDALHLMEGDG